MSYEKKKMFQKIWSLKG